MDTETITLDYPIKANGSETSLLVLKRPTVGDLLASKQGGRKDIDAEVFLLATLCSVSPDDIKRLDVSDYHKLNDALGKMLGTSQD